jgi:putative endonuclease
MRDPGCYSVYLVTNRGRTTLYAGVTGDLEGRVWEHRNKVDPGSFTAQYGLGILVWHESFPTAREAIAFEKKLKGWTRAKKNALIAEMNPGWRDLAEDWFG